MTDQAERPAPGDRAVPVQRVVLAGLAMLSVLAAVIHFAVAGSHFQEYWLFGVFLLGVAWLQLGWAAAALLRPTRLLVSSGAVLNAAVIVVYILTRTVGNIVGPDPGEAEPAGFGDLLCTAAEAVIVTGCVWLLVTRVSRAVRRDQAGLAAATGAGVLAALLSVALIAGGPEMVMTAGASPASASGAGAAARAAGYRPITPSGLPVVHYLNPAFYRATLLGGPVLDTSQPQSLVYANTPKGAVLVAAMYITTPRGATPQPGGCLTQWHVHTNLCLRAGLGVVGVVGAGHPACPAGSRKRVTPAMMHVWFVPIPGGPTAVDAPDAQVVRAAEQVAAPHNGTA
jgi:Flp pilus assembly pilin Flp